MLGAQQRAQYTSFAFGRRLRESGILGSMGSVGDALDNAVAESFFATLQTELLDRSSWPTRRMLTTGGLRLHRGLLQPDQTPFDPGLPKPGRVRESYR
jgi:transposase InsO family protein